MTEDQRTELEWARAKKFSTEYANLKHSEGHSPQWSRTYNAYFDGYMRRFGSDMIDEKVEKLKDKQPSSFEDLI